MLLIPERPQSLHCCQHVVSTPCGSLPTLVKDSTLAPKPCTRHLHHR